MNLKFTITISFIMLILYILFIFSIFFLGIAFIFLRIFINILSKFTSILDVHSVTPFF